MRNKAFSSSIRGQSRILEAVIAAVIIFIVFSVSIFLVQTSNVKVSQEKADLDRLGYNVLHEIVESGSIEATLEEDVLGGEYLKTLIHRSLPSSIYFNLTIYNCTGSIYGKWYYGNPASFSNAPAKIFANSIETSSTSLIYTSKRGNIYYLVLTLTKAWGSEES
ncbi:MAG: hypothetical protein QW222_07705 [Candidatus Bathyarchaeia archaeon]